MQNDGGDLHPSGGGGPSSSPTLNGNGTPRTAGIKRPREGEHDDLDVINAAEGPLQLSPSQRKRQAMTAATPPPLPSSPPVTIAIQDLLTSSQPSTRSSPPLASAPPFATYADISNAQPTLSQGTLPPLQPPSLSSSLALPSTAPLLIDPRQLDPNIPASSSSSVAAVLLDNVPASSSSTTSPSPPSSPPELFASPADVPRVGGWIVPRRRAGWETPDVAEALRELLGSGEDDDEEKRVGQSLAERLAAEEGGAMQEDEEGEEGSPAAAAAAIPRKKKRLAPWCNPWRREDLGEGGGSSDEDADPEDEPLFAFLPSWRPSASIKVEETKDVKLEQPAAVEAAPSSSQTIVEKEEPSAPTSSLPSTLVSGFSSRTASSSTSALPTAVTAMPSAPESGPSSPPAAFEAQAPPVPPRAREYNGLSRSTSLCHLPIQEARDHIAHLIEHRGRQAPETKRHLAQRVRDGRLHLGGAPQPRPVRSTNTGEQDARDDKDEVVRVIMMDLGEVEVDGEEAREGERLILALSEDERIDVVGVPRAFAKKLLEKPGPGVDEAAVRAKVEAEIEERRRGEEEERERQQEQAQASTSAAVSTSQPQPPSAVEGQDATATELTTLRTTLSTLETTHASLLTSHSSLEARLASATSDLDLVRDLYQSSSNLSRTATLECDQLREENTALRVRAERGVAMHAERYRVERVKWEERERELLGRVRVLEGVVAREEVVRGRREEARERAWVRGEEEREKVRMREVRRAEELRELEEEAREEAEREREKEGMQSGEAVIAMDEEVAMKVDDEPQAIPPSVMAPELALAHAPSSPPP